VRTLEGPGWGLPLSGFPTWQAQDRGLCTYRTALRCLQEPSNPPSSRRGWLTTPDGVEGYFLGFLWGIFLSVPRLHSNLYFLYSGFRFSLQYWPARTHLCPQENVAVT